VELEQLINLERFYNFKNIPISLHRAKSHFHNPRADKNDIIMIIAFKNNEIVGYMGILPDFLFIESLTKHRDSSLRGTKQSIQTLTDSFTNNSNIIEKLKFGWFSCFWVDETMRGEGLGTQLVEKALSEWSGNILITEFAPLSKKLYLKTNSFNNSTFLNGIRLYNRFDLQHILPPKKRIFHKIKSLLSITDNVLNFVFDIRFLFINKNSSSLKLERISKFDSEIENFINSNNNTQLFKRETVDFNWIIKYPWIIQSDKIDSLNKRYYFSAVAKSFENFCCKLRNKNNEVVAFLFFTKRENTLKLPYCIYKSKYLHEIILVILQQIIELKISTFTTYNNEISDQLLKQKTNSLFKKKMIREYLISNNLKEYFDSNNFVIQDGDGDCVFT